MAIAIVLFSSAAVAGSDLEGTWILQPSPGVDGISTRLVFKLQNAVLTGTQEGCCGVVALANLRVQGDEISFQQGSVVTQGVHRGNELRLSTKYREAALPYPAVYRRASAADLKVLRAEVPVPFERSQLTPLHDVAANGLARTPPMGLGNWVQPNDAAVRKAADQMVSMGLRDAGYVYLQIDSGWQGKRDAMGKLQPNKNFPDMKALADYVHAAGLKFGIYSSPGPLDCLGYVGSHGHEEQDARTFAEWGVDYVKYDWCSAYSLYKTQTDMQALYQKMGQALQATGRPMIYSLCQYGLFDVGSWGRKVGGNLWRTTFDIQDHWVSMSENGFDKNGSVDHAGPGGWNDPDNLQIGKGGMTIEEYRTQMTLWSIMAAPLIVEMRDNDLTRWGPEIRGILLNNEVIAIDQDRLGRQGSRVRKQGDIEIWTKALADGAWAVALFNRGAGKARAKVRWSDLQWMNAKNVRDLWRRQDLMNATQGYETTIPSHGSILLRVTLQ